MPRHNAPWFRSSKNAWYATVDGKKLSLGVSGKHNRKEALQAFARLITGQAREREPEPKQEQKPSTDARTVRTLFNEFIAHAEANFKAWTVRTYRRFLTPFGKRHGTVKAEAITSADVESFSKRPTWSDTTRHGCIKAIATAFRWGGHPLAVNAPPKASRGAEAVIPPDDFAKLEAEANGDFRALLRFLWNTGARPSEAFALTLEAVDFVNGVVTLKEHKTARRTGKPRLIFLSADALAVLHEQRERYAKGPAFRMTNGKAWTLNAAVNRLWRLNRKCGVHATLYGFRHSFATDALTNGVADATVAALLGHTSTAMLFKHYAHLGARANAMRDALKRVR